MAFSTLGTVLVWRYLSFSRSVVSLAESTRVDLNQSTCLMIDLRTVKTLPRDVVVEVETPSCARGEGAGSAPKPGAGRV